jgi:hypothetical protein
MSERIADWVALVIAGETVEARRDVLERVPAHQRRDVETLVKRLWPGEKARRQRLKQAALQSSLRR